jgi:hypothetical protein
MTKDILLKWLPGWLVDYRLRHGLPAELPLIVLADGHASRYNPALWDRLRHMHVHLILLPAHLTHVFQPVDTHLARAMKKKREYHNMNFHSVAKQHPMRTLAGVISHVMAVSEMYHLHVEAWMSVGLYPLNLTCIDGRGFLDQQDQELKTSFQRAPLEYDKVVKHIKKLAKKYKYPITAEQIRKRQLGGTRVTHSTELQDVWANVKYELQQKWDKSSVSARRTLPGRWILAQGEFTPEEPLGGTAEPRPVLVDEVQLQPPLQALAYDVDWASSGDEYTSSAAPPPPKRLKRSKTQ